MNILAIGAHFDDIEIGCGGTLIKHIKKKDEVYMYVLTDSEYKDYDGTMLRTKEIAFEEGRNAAAILGVKELKCDFFETKKLEYSVALIESINKTIDEFEIDTVYTHWVHDVHQDHSAIGRATLNAGRHIPRILMYRSNWYATNVHFANNFFVDISQYIETKVEAIKAHTTEYRKRGDEWIDFVKYHNRNSGIEMNVEYAEVFEIIKYLV